jgi:hypothetical protein
MKSLYRNDSTIKRIPKNKNLTNNKDLTNKAGISKFPITVKIYDDEELKRTVEEKYKKFNESLTIYMNEINECVKCDQNVKDRTCKEMIEYERQSLSTRAELGAYGPYHDFTARYIYSARN